MAGRGGHLGGGALKKEATQTLGEDPPCREGEKSQGDMRSVCDHSRREEDGRAQSETGEKWPCLEGRTNLGSEVGQEGRRKVQDSPWFWPEHQRKQGGRGVPDEKSGNSGEDPEVGFG